MCVAAVWSHDLPHRYFPYYFDFIWYLTPHSRQYKKTSDLVHKFAMDIITKRRKELQEGVGGANRKIRNNGILFFIRKVLLLRQVMLQLEKEQDSILISLMCCSKQR